MTSLTIKDFDAAINLGATSESGVSKLVKAWEAKNNERAKRVAGMGLIAVSLAACGGSEDGPVEPVEPVEPPVKPLNASLTIARDTFVGTTEADTFNVADATSVSGLGQIVNITTLTPLDSIDGGAGIDTLTVIAIDGFAVQPGVTVVNVENANISSLRSVTADVSNWTGLTALNVTAGGDADVVAAVTTNVVSVVSAHTSGDIVMSGGNNVTLTANGGTGGAITVTGAAGNVIVTASSVGQGGEVVITGGDTVTVNQTASNALGTDFGAVTVIGDAGTTAVTVNQSAASAVVSNGSVAIAAAAAAVGVADTISSVTLSNFGQTTITSSALSTLNVTGGATGFESGDITISPQSLTTPATTLALNSAGGFMGGISGTAAYTSINVNSSAGTTISGLAGAGLTTLNFTGAGATTISNLTAPLVDINVTGAGGVTLGTALAAGTDFDGGVGADSITITGATTSGITMGAGADTVNITSGTIVNAGLGALGSLSGGDGVDTLVMASGDAASASLNRSFNDDVTGFETLRLSDALSAGDSLNLATLNNVTRVEITTASAVAAEIANLKTGGTIEFEADMTTLTVDVLLASAGTADVLNIELNAAGLTIYGSVVAADVETINIASSDTSASGVAAFVNGLDLAGSTGLTSVVVSGNNGLALIGVNTITTFDASAVVADAIVGGNADTATGLAVSYVSLNSDVQAVVTIKGGDGNDTLTGDAARDTITGGAGADSLTGGAGADIFEFASGDTGTTVAMADTITDFATGVDVISTSKAAGNVTIVDGTSLTTIELFTAAADAVFTAGTGANDVYAALNAGGGDGWVAVDENDNGSFDAGDTFIVLTGLTGATAGSDLVAADFI